MNIEIINTGSELLLGRVLNLHQQWLCRQLADLGWVVTRQVCVADSGPAIQAASCEALARAELVIVTGGLGPTSDDLTRDLIAQRLGRKLIFDPSILAAIEELFTRRKRVMPESMKVQAMVPEGARVLPNPHGSAPGLAMEVRRGDAGLALAAERGWLILLPGPSRELRPMFTASVVPLLRAELPSPTLYVCRTLKCAGLGESLVEQRVGGPLQPLRDAGLELGYCARVGEVEVRLSARGERAGALVSEGEQIVRAALESRIFGVDDETLEAVVIRLLTERKQTVALAESCTGGLIAHRLTNVPGASAAFLGSVVAYSNDVKMEALGVRAETLALHGAISEAVAREMAASARERLRANHTLAVTGIAGPDGGSDDKPVGTVFIALASAQSEAVERHYFPLDRETFKFTVSQQALDWLRRSL